MKDLFNINIFGLIGIKRHEFWIGAIFYSDEGFNQNANAQDIFMALKFLLCKIVMIRIHLNSGHSLLRQPSSRPAQCDVSAANFSELTLNRLEKKIAASSSLFILPMRKSPCILPRVLFSKEASTCPSSDS